VVSENTEAHFTKRTHWSVAVTRPGVKGILQDKATRCDCGIDHSNDRIGSVDCDVVSENTKDDIASHTPAVTRPEDQNINHWQHQDVPTTDHHWGLWPHDILVCRASLFAEALLALSSQKHHPRRTHDDDKCRPQSC
jgi:hypothetical protein